MEKNKKRRKRGQSKLCLDCCELCGLGSGSVRMHVHHIIPRCDERSSQDNWNLAVVCPNCHDDVHRGGKTIVGVYNSTSGRRVLFYSGDTPPADFLLREYWHILPEDNPHVIMRGARKKHGKL